MCASESDEGEADRDDQRCLAFGIARLACIACAGLRLNRCPRRVPAHRVHGRHLALRWRLAECKLHEREGLSAGQQLRVRLGLWPVAIHDSTDPGVSGVFGTIPGSIESAYVSREGPKLMRRITSAIAVSSDDSVVPSSRSRSRIAERTRGAIRRTALKHSCRVMPSALATWS